MQIRAVYPKKRSSSPFASELGDEGASAELPEALDAVSPTRRCLRNEAHSFRVVVGLETTLIGVDLEVDLEAAERRERGAAADLLAIALRGWTRRLKDPPTMKAICGPVQPSHRSNGNYPLRRPFAGFIFRGKKKKRDLSPIGLSV